MPQISAQIIARIFNVVTDDDIVQTIAQRVKTASELTRKAGLDEATFQRALGVAADMGHSFTGEALAGIARMISRNQEQLVRGFAGTFRKAAIDDVLGVLGRTAVNYSDEAIEGMLELASRAPRGTVWGIIDAVNLAWRAGGQGLLSALPPNPTLIRMFEDFRYVAREWPGVRGIDQLADDLCQDFTHRFFGSWHQLVYLVEMKRFLTGKLPGVGPGDIDLIQIEKSMNRLVAYVDELGQSVVVRMWRRADQEVLIRGVKHLQELKAFTWAPVLARLDVLLKQGTAPLAALEQALLGAMGRTRRGQRDVVQPWSYKQLHDTFHLARVQGAKYQLILFERIPDLVINGRGLREHFKDLMRKHMDPLNRYIQDLDDILLDGVR